MAIKESERRIKKSGAGCFIYFRGHKTASFMVRMECARSSIQFLGLQKFWALARGASFFFIIFMLSSSFVFAQEDFREQRRTEMMEYAFRQEAIRQAFRQQNLKVLGRQILEQTGPSLEEKLKKYFSFDSVFNLAYNDNLYEVRDEHKGDLTLAISPGLNFRFGKKSERFVSKFTAGFTSESYLNAKRNYVNPAFGGAVEFKTPHANLFFDNTYKRSTVATSSTTIIPTRMRGISQFNANIMRIGAGYTLGNLGFSGTFYKREEFYPGESKTTNNNYDQRAELKSNFSLRNLPKLSFLEEVDLGQTKYTKDPDDFRNGHYQNVKVGIKRLLTPKIDLSTTVGWQFSRFKGTENFNNNVTEIQAKYMPSKKGFYFLNVSHSLRAATDRDNVTEQTTITLGNSQMFSKKLTAQTLYSFFYNKYSGTGTNGYSYTVSTSLVYQIRKWLSTTLGYGFDRNDAEGSGGDSYYANNVSFQIRASF